MEIFIPYTWWCHVPFLNGQGDLLTLKKNDKNDVTFIIEHEVFRVCLDCLCCFQAKRVSKKTWRGLDTDNNNNIWLSSTRCHAGWQPFSFLGLVRDVLFSFVFSFLFHLVVSLIYGVERSLGSPQDHRNMGMVWFGGWPVWFVCFAFFLRGTGIVCGDQYIPLNFVRRSRSRAVLDSIRKQVIIMGDNKKEDNNKDDMVESSCANDETGIQNNDTQKEPEMDCSFDETQQLLRRNTHVWRPMTIVGTLVWVYLVVNAIVVGTLVVQCMDRGCCKDDADTLDSCVATGYPS